MIPVLTPPRSFSSLITAMLGQHPELYAPAELECFTGNTLAAPAYVVDTGQLGCGRHPAITNAIGSSKSHRNLLPIDRGFD
jgi:hypothetical protein